MRSTTITLLLLAGTIAAGPAFAVTLTALTGDARIVQIDTEKRRSSAPVAIRAAASPVVAIAVRPADGQLYGLTKANTIVKIDAKTGATTMVSTLDKPLELGSRAAISFNPTVDRLRIVGQGGTNYRVNVDTGAVTVDGGLKYAPASSFAGTTPSVSAAAYTNAYAGSKETALFTIDTMLSQLNKQAPPNDGVQQPVAISSVTLPHGVPFAIASDGAAGNTAYVLASGQLHRINLDDAKVMTMGKVAGLPASPIMGVTVAK